MNLVSKVTSDDEFKFRFQIQVHLTADANVPDHCTAYALSDPKDKFLSVECQHDHESSCPQCEELKSALKEVEAALSKSSTIARMCVMTFSILTRMQYKRYRPGRLINLGHCSKTRRALQSLVNSTRPRYL